MKRKKHKQKQPDSMPSKKNWQHMTKEEEQEYAEILKSGDADALGEFLQRVRNSA